MVELLLAASLMRARLGTNVTSVANEGGAAEVLLELANPTYTPANNTTVTVEAYRGNVLVRTASRTLDVPAEASTTARITLELGEPGEWQLRTLVEHPTLLCENATLERRVVDMRAVTVEEGLLEGGGGALWTLLLVLALAGVALVYWAWRYDWRPGWAFNHLREMISRRQGT